MNYSGTCGKAGISTVVSRGSGGGREDQVGERVSSAERDALVRSLRGFTRDLDVAEDCFQSAYVRLEEYRLKSEVNSDVRFLSRAARNIAIDEARKMSVRRSSAVDIREILRDAEVSQPLQDEVLLMRERLSIARAVLDSLPERTRRIFMMHRFTRAKYREIAEELGISVSAVEKHIAKASLALAESIKHEDQAMER